MKSDELAASNEQIPSTSSTCTLEETGDISYPSNDGIIFCDFQNVSKRTKYCLFRLIVCKTNIQTNKPANDLFTAIASGNITVLRKNWYSTNEHIQLGQSE